MNPVKCNYSSPYQHLPSSLNYRSKLSTAITTLLASVSVVAAFNVHADEVTTQIQPSAQVAAEIISNEPSANEATQKEPKPEVAESGNTLDSVVVTSRKREELVQDVPIPETVLSGKVLERDNAVTMIEFAQKAPNLLISASNSRQTSVALRGLGKNSGNEAIQGSVGIIIDGVVLSQAGMSYSSFVDVDQIEVLRGPQGTLQGKNTTLGALNITTKKPSFTPQYTVEAGYGSRNTFDGKLTATGPLVDDLLAYRASFYATDGDGQIENIYKPLGGTWQGPERLGGRFQLLFTPREDLSARIILDYDASAEHTNLSPYIADPKFFDVGGPARTSYTSRLARSYFGGYQPLIGSVTRDHVDLNSAQSLPIHQSGVSAEINKNFGEYTLTSITAYRYNDFNFRNDFDYTHFDIQHLSGTIGDTHQYSQEFRLASPIGPAIDYQVGLFAMKSESNTLSRTQYGRDAGAFYATNGQYAALTTARLQASLDGVYNKTEVDPTSESLAVFGQANWHITDKATLTIGLRETYEVVGNYYNKTSTGGAPVTGAALAIRNTQRGIVYGAVSPDDQSNTSLSWLVNPSYQLNKDILLYASTSHGTKSGAVQVDNLGNVANVDPEDSLDFELGFKSSWLNRSLFFNANIYQTEITDYQTTAQVASTTNPGTYVSQLTNVGGVRLQGLEIDGAWNPTNRLSITYGAAYNYATYSDYKNATCPVELNVSAATVCNFNGKQVAAAPRVTANIGIDYRQPVSDKLIGHIFLNNVYRSRANLAPTLSAYTWQEAYNITNGGIGVSTRDNKYEFNLVAKNLFDTKYAVNKGQYSSTAGVSEFWGDERYVGVVFRSKF